MCVGGRDESRFCDGSEWRLEREHRCGNFRFKGETLSTMGLGATISQATDAGNFTLLLAPTITMAALVVTINRLVWRRLYRLAEARFKLES